MTKNNMRFWEKSAKPPASALMPIRSGRLAGKSDINPQWRIQKLTQLFGPCGQGWKIENVKYWEKSLEGGNTALFCSLDLFWKTEDGEWSEPIPGQGGNTLIRVEKRGPYLNDEAYKMAFTDALGTAAKLLGVAANVYMGLWDGSKHHEPEPDPYDLEEEKKKILQGFQSCPSLPHLKNHAKKHLGDIPEALKQWARGEYKKRKKELELDFQARKALQGMEIPENLKEEAMQLAKIGTVAEVETLMDKIDKERRKKNEKGNGNQKENGNDREENRTQVAE